MFNLELAFSFFFFQTERLSASCVPNKTFGIYGLFLMFGDFSARQSAAITNKAATNCRSILLGLFAGEIECVAEIKCVSRR